MKTPLRKDILGECNKLIDRYHDYLFALEENARRKAERLGAPFSKTILHPSYWDIHDAFNPFLVRSKKRLNTYAHTLSNKLKRLEYEPRTSIIYSVPKASGGLRHLNVFQIPDAAVSRYIYKSLLGKNATRFSNYAYAYRDDRDAHDAVLRINSDWLARDRVYVAEFDFSKFFDGIAHKYIWEVLHKPGFLFTEIEEYVLGAFLTSRFSPQASYQPNSGTTRDKGVPQGTSVSLFLANLACWELDQELERIGVHFARYADDTLIWSSSYDKIVRAFDAIHYFSKLIGVPINFSKSEGISLISERPFEEIRPKSQVTFLGYDIGLRRVSITNKTITHVKKKISYIIYENLLQPLGKGVFNSTRLNLVDWDYISTIAQIRRYLYGGLNDEKLRRYKLGLIDNIHFRGLMSYYPLVNDDEQLKSLDGWLIHALKQALRKRERMWVGNMPNGLPGPIEDWIEQISELKTWTHPTTSRIYDLRIPSFLQINRAMRIGLQRGGLSQVTNPRARYYPGSGRREA